MAPRKYTPSHRDAFSTETFLLYSLGNSEVDTDVSGRAPKYLLGFEVGFESWAPLEDSLSKAGQGFCSTNRYTNVYFGCCLEAVANLSEKVPRTESFLGVRKSRAGGYKLPEPSGIFSQHPILSPVPG